MIMYKVGKYHPSDSMSDLICDNYSMLLVMSRFGIDLGFGEATIEDVCLKNGVDIETFLAVVNILISKDRSCVEVDYTKISPASLIQYLHSSHSYFLDYRLPSIRVKLKDALGQKGDVSEVILNYYDEYVAEVNKHMGYEEDILYPYISSTIKGTATEAYSIDIYSKHHEKVDTKLTELKNIIIKYYPARSTNELNSVLYEIFSCERDLASHGDIEDYLLVPTMKVFEELRSK